MLNMKKKLSLAAAAVGVMTMVACASADKAKLPEGAEPRAEIQRLDADIQAAQQNQYDRLSPKNFATAVEKRDDAKKMFQDGKDAGKVLNEIAEARAAIDKANAVGAKSAPVVQPILQARQFALDAKATDYQNKQLRDADDDFADLGKDMEKDKFQVNADEISGLEKAYRDVERESVKIAVLKGSRMNMQRAEDNGAKRDAPQTYQMAMTLLTSAERAIDSSPRDAAGYQDQVNKSAEASQKLREVAEIARNRKTSESVALTIWTQEQKLNASSGKLNASQSELQMTEAQLAEQARLTQAKEGQLGALQARNSRLLEGEALKQRIEQAKKEFNPEEAEIVKDGRNLIVRLKKMNFSIGKSDVKPEDYELLKKVQELIAVVPAQTIVVEGHTDSTGSDKINMPLSEQRANSVKEYLSHQEMAPNTSIEAKGYGSEKPLVSNKTKEGRATNRRVDIVVETSSVL